VTGVSELRTVRVISAAPEAIRVSVLGGRTQLDVALPADVPVAAFLPELARLIGSRDDRRDDDAAARDERRTFWVLARADGGDALAPDQTLRQAGVANGELLRISARRALSPPTLYDDVVDAAARLNRASYAAWDATSAGVMAFAGLWLCVAAWVYLLAAQPLSAHRGVVVAGALLTTVAMVCGAALANRVLGRSDVATAAALPVITLSAALGWVLTHGLGQYGLAAACVLLVVLSAACFRVIGTGHWAYIAAAVVFTFGAVAVLSGAAGAPTAVVAVTVATVAVLGTLAVTRLTLRRRFPEPTERREDPFTAEGTDAGAEMPSAEEVWARVRSATLTRAGLFAGLAAVVVSGAAMLLWTLPNWPALVFALTCAAVLGLRSRRARTVPERAALAVPATVLALVACAHAQQGAGTMGAGGVGVLAAVAVVAALAGLAASGGRLPRWVPTAAAYLEYASVAALIPLALWPLGIYDRLGW
jgi:type VII secretion integral membrane protein EccD